MWLWKLSERFHPSAPDAVPFTILKECPMFHLTLPILYFFHSSYTFLNPFIYHHFFLLCVKWLG